MKRFCFAILAAMTITLVLCGPTTGQSRFYFGDEGGHKLYWSYTNGSNETVVSLNTPVELTVDQADCWVYWLTAHYGHGQYGYLYRARLHDPSQTEKLIETGYTQGGLEVDHVTGWIYWGAPAVTGHPNFSVVRTRTDGPDWDLWLPEVSPRMGGMDIDSKARLLFWTAGTSLMRAHLDRAVAEEVELDWGLLREPTFDGGVTLDTLYRKVYWAERGSYGGSSLEGNTTRIFRSQYMGGPPTLIYAAEDARVTDLVFEPVTRTLYWVEEYMKDGAGVLAVRKSTLGSSLPLKGTYVIYPAHKPGGFAVFADPGSAGLSAPGINQTVETTVELVWKPVLGSQRYDVQVASDEDFQSIVFKENTPGTKSGFVAPVAETPYYWRVQSNACFIAPHWSETRAFITGDTGPLAARLVYPGPGDKVEPIDEFRWDTAPEAKMYTLQVANTPDFSPVQVTMRELTKTSVILSGLERGATLFWRVGSYDAEGRYTFTAPVMFSVAELLAAVDLTSPEDGSVGVTAFATLEWIALDRADSYEIEVSRSADFSDLLFAETATRTQYSFDSPLAYESTYYWRVRGINKSGPGNWSATWMFTIAVGTATENLADIPTTTRLQRPYPNPASHIVAIPFELAERASVRIDVFDMAGRLVTIVEPGLANPGWHIERIDVSHWPSGAYAIVLNGDHLRRQFVLVVK